MLMQGPQGPFNHWMTPGVMIFANCLCGRPGFIKGERELAVEVGAIPPDAPTLTVNVYTFGQGGTAAVAHCDNPDCEALGRDALAERGVSDAWARCQN